MTRLQRARAIAGEDGLGIHDCAPEYLCDVLCKEGISRAWDERHLIAASLVLDGLSIKQVTAAQKGGKRR